MTPVHNSLAPDLPGIAARADWDALTTDELHGLIRDLYQHLADREPAEPTDGVLERSQQLEETMRVAGPLQYQYIGLIKDAFNTASLRSTLGLPEGKTAFRDATDLVAKTHGIRANEASARIRLAASITPARASDPDRDEAVGETRLPILGQFQGRVNPSKLSSALSMIDEVDKNAAAAGKDTAFRDKLRTLVQKDFTEKIEHTTPEEFSRYVSQRKKDLLASVDPPDNKFTQQQTDAMHDVRRIGLVRGNKNAVEYRVILDAEGDEATQALLYAMMNPPAQGNDDFETRGTGQRRMHALRDVVKFALADMDKAGFRGASGAHAQMTVITDYATLLEGVHRDLADLLPAIRQEQRTKLLAMLAEAHSDDDSSSLSEVAVSQVEEPATGRSTQTVAVGESVLNVPAPQTTDLGEILDDDNLDRLQQRILQGMYTKYIPPDVIFRMRCDIAATPVTLTGQREVLSIGRRQRIFPDAIRRAIVARDRGCAVPGCHWVASLCEMHHVQYWSQDGETSTDNGATLCAHHHQAVHSGQIRITRVDGEFRFVLHPLVDPDQQPRKNYFFQS